MNEFVDPTPETERAAENRTRREVEYRTLGAFLEDVEFLAAHPHETVGNWSFAKIVQHLADSLNRSFDGFDYKVNLFIRLVAPFLKRRFLTQPMPTGIKLPREQEAKLPDDSLPRETAMANLRAALARFEKESPAALHPAFGKLTPEEWVQLHLRHCAMHMSFVHPI